MPDQPDVRPPEPGEPTSERVRDIFSRISDRYDLVNALASFGVDRLWRRATVKAAHPTPDGRILDLCAGTGDLTLSMARIGRPAEIVASDLVDEMLEVARRKAARYDGPTEIAFRVADAQALPFEDESFDAVTVGFGVRNLTDRPANFSEVRRVLRPGGRYAIMEFSRPRSAFFRRFYHWYLSHVVVWLGGVLSGDRESYQYLNDSIRRFPDQPTLADELRAAGFASVSWRDLSFGIVALHVAVK